MIEINLVGTFNVLRLAANAMVGNEPTDGDRGVIVMTASVAAYDGQIGQAAYAASKGGIASLTLSAARDLADKAIRVMTIAPGVMETPMMAGLPGETKTILEALVPHPARLGRPEEYAALVAAHPRQPAAERRGHPARRRAPDAAALMLDRPRRRGPSSGVRGTTRSTTAPTVSSAVRRALACIRLAIVAASWPIRSSWSCIGIAHKTVVRIEPRPLTATRTAAPTGIRAGRVHRNAMQARKLRKPGMITTHGIAALYARW